MANPDLPDYFTALYFGLTTLTTVGFGDITPVTFEGRLVVSVSILAGIAIIPVQLSSLAEALLNRDTITRAAEGRATVCSQCAREWSQRQGGLLLRVRQPARPMTLPVIQDLINP